MPGLQKVAAALVAPGKGILAADASIATMSRRLEAVGAAPAAAMLNITRPRLRVRMRDAPVQGSRVAGNCQHPSQASAAGSPDCALPLSNERQAGRA